MTVTEALDTTGAGSSAISVALMNDFEVVVRGLARMLEPYADRVHVVELDVNVSPAQPVDITMYDTFAVTRTDAGAVAELVANPLSGKIVVYSWETPSDLVRSGLDVGIGGYLPKTMTAEELVSALERVHAGEQVVVQAQGSEAEAQAALSAADAENVADASHAWPGREFGLTHRESEILALITQGLSNQDIAARCYLSINTVKSYIRGAYRKIDVETRARAVIWGMNNGLALDQVRITRPDPTR